MFFTICMVRPSFHFAILTIFDLAVGVLTPPVTEYGSAESQFKKIRELDPFRIDDIDILSNVLYVSENRLELSKLAHEVLALERDRPEICCLVGSCRFTFSRILQRIRYKDRSETSQRSTCPPLFYRKPLLPASRP